MASLSDLQGLLDALKRVRAQGLRSVEYSGRRVEYRSDAELAAAIAALEQDIAVAGGAGVVRTFLFTSDKGL